MNYRNEARQCLQRAQAELDAGVNERVRYAALELRLAMEGLTYDRALAYKDEFPPSEYETWQPRKVMAVLLDIDPVADQDHTLGIGIEEAPGVPVPASETQPLGSERVLNMATLRRHYDALGSFLHALSMKQVKAGAVVDYDKMRARCAELAGYVQAVLSSPIFNVTIGSIATMECLQCSSRIRKRIPFGKAEVGASCYECEATYTLVDNGDGSVAWKPDQQEVSCGNAECRQKIFVWRRQLGVGRRWTCPNCGGRNTFALGIRHDGKED